MPALHLQTLSCFFTICKCTGAMSLPSRLALHEGTAARLLSRVIRAFRLAHNGRLPYLPEGHCVDLGVSPTPLCPFHQCLILHAGLTSHPDTLHKTYYYILYPLVMTTKGCSHTRVTKKTMQVQLTICILGQAATSV